MLELTNDASASTNVNGWVFVNTPTSGFSSPFNSTLSSNTGIVTWTFNMRQIRTDPSGFATGNYGVAFILAGTSQTAFNAGSGYAIVLGQSGATDPVRLATYNNGLSGTLTNIITSNTTGLTDFGNEYLSVKVTYDPSSNTWEMFLRNDGGSAFVDPETGSLTSQGTVVNSTYTGTAMSYMGAYWGGATASTQTAFFDNVKVKVNYFTTTISSNRGFRMMASPVATTYADVLAEVWTQGATGADASNGSPNVWTWNNNASGGDASNWTGVTDLTATVNGTQGFLYYHFDDNDYSGSRDNTSVVLSVSGSEKSAPGVVNLNTNASSWTLVGNPFAVSIQYNLMTRTELAEDNARIWNPSGDLTGTWATITSTDKIAPFQAFFVQTSATPSSPSLTIDNSARASGGTFLGKVADNEPMEITMNLDAGNGFISQARARFHQEAQFGRDPFDAVRMMPLSSNYLDAYFKGTDDRALTWNAVPVLTEPHEMPLYISMTRSGTVNVAISKMSIPAEWSATLLDRVTGTRTVLSEGTQFTFTHTRAAKQRSSEEILRDGLTAAADDADHRFTLILSPRTTSSEPTARVTKLALEQNFPNPFNPSTEIRFSLPQAGQVRLGVYDVNGRLIEQLVNSAMTTGNHTIRWNAAGQASGVYMLRLEFEGTVLTRKMTLLK
jgi:hypothetical protein